LIDALAA
jgi:nucleosome binding factor SPN SPT16 subunit